MIKKNVWVVVDQTLFAGSIFIMNIALARWLTPYDFGLFTVLFTLILLLGVIHTAFFTEPMLVFGGKYFKNRLNTYFRTLLLGQLVCVSLLIVVIGLVSLHYNFSVVSQELIFAALIATPFILSLWTIRRACYVIGAQHFAALSGLIYLILISAGGIALYQFDRLSAVNAFYLLASANIFVSTFMYRVLSGHNESIKQTDEFTEIAEKHWKYGRIAFISAILSWIPGNIFYLLIPVFFDTESSAALKALMNLIMPVLHIISALSISMIALLVVETHNLSNFSKKFRIIISSMLIISVFYYVVLLVWGGDLIHWLYQGQYDYYASLIWLLGLLPISAAFVGSISAVLRTMEYPKIILYAYLLTALQSLTVGLFLLIYFKLLGVSIALLLSGIVTAFAMIIQLNYKQPSLIKRLMSDKNYSKA